MPGVNSLTPARLERLLAHYPSLATLPQAERDAVLGQEAQFLHVGADTMLFDEGAPCQGFPLVLSGEVQVTRGAANGRQLELYRVAPGELCLVSASCLFSQQPLGAHGHTLGPTELLLLAPHGFDRWCAHAAFRQFVFGVFARRLADLVALAEAVSFQRLDQRLAHALLGHGSTVRSTHQALADELGTVREIVSRLLSRFERAGWVALGRERIDILQPQALRNLATGLGDQSLVA
jgi:CRP/FNR family transcriptional regulator, anaerobic regulatory protein